MTNEKMDKYKDPENIEELTQRLLRCQNFGEIYELIKEVYPTWIKFFTDRYSIDYNYLNENWKSATKGKMTQIMIVDYIGYSDEYSFIRNLAELFTLSGFVVRTVDELVLCDNCHRAIPSEQEHSRMQEFALPIPEVWNKCCSKCVSRPVEM